MSMQLNLPSPLTLQERERLGLTPSEDSINGLERTNSVATLGIITRIWQCYG